MSSCLQLVLPCLHSWHVFLSVKILLSFSSHLIFVCSSKKIPDQHLIDTKIDAQRDREVNDDSDSFISSCSFLEEVRDEDGKVVRSCRV